MKISARIKLLFPVLLVITFGCMGEEPPYRKQTFPVKGKIVVDGKEPGSSIKVSCSAISEADSNPAHYTESSTMSLPDGSFQISTYDAGDGVPQGEYALTIFWGTLNVMSRTYSGPDRLKERYSDPKTSEIKFTVSDEPVDLGLIQVSVPVGDKKEDSKKSTIPDIDLGAGNDANKPAGK